MSSEYSEELKKRAKEKLLKKFDLLCDVGYGRIEINFNKDKQDILIIPSPHFRVGPLTNKNV